MRNPSISHFAVLSKTILLSILLISVSPQIIWADPRTDDKPSDIRATYTIFQPTDAPVNVDANDGNAVELGTKFRTSQAGRVRAIRYYKSSGFTGTRTGHLWSSTGTMLAEVQFTNETSSGWQEAELSVPVDISSNTTYIVSYFSSSGHYCYTSGLFASAGITNGPLTALADGVDGGNGLYDYSATSTFPTTTYSSSSYYVDVVFEPGTSGIFYGTSNYVPRFESPGSIVNGSIYDDGSRVGIGTTDVADNNFKLFVESGVRTRKVKVDQDNWPDYVFLEGYPLLSLDSLKAFIRNNGHLPSVPSADRVSMDGLDLGQTQATLLMKIEEMTLYIIQLNEEMAKLKAQIESMRKVERDSRQKTN